MNGKDGSSENFASLSGVSAPDLNDTIGTGIRYGRQGGVCCVISLKNIQRREVPAPRLPDYSRHQMNRGKEGEIVFVFLLTVSQ